MHKTPLRAPRARVTFGCGIVAAMAAALVACGGGGAAGEGPSGAGAVDLSAPAPGGAPAGNDAASAPAPPEHPANDTPVVSTREAPQLGGCELFPPEAVFNTRIDDPQRFPAHPRSAAWIASIGVNTPFRADWWRGEDPDRLDSYFGMPINVLDGQPHSTDWAVLQYDFRPSGVSSEVGWPHESDCAVASGNGFDLVRGCSAVPAPARLFPFPKEAPKHGGGNCNDPNRCGDHHLLVLEQNACRLWEAYFPYKLDGQWYGLATAGWDLNSLSMRPDTWTAAGAAALPIAPFIAKVAEADTGEIRHALRVTFRDAVLSRGYDWPARHGAGGDTPGGIPFGAVLRLRADFPIPEHWGTHAKAIATAAKRYGLYVHDIGEDLYVPGEPSAGWDPALFGQLSTIPLSQLEFVDLGAITRDPRFSVDSMAASWR
ncbi:hypothetical protein WG922_04835 [Ramlibacter sp. AN1015]|uniref:hypothetical protein n=1 Tax=Ramlibacter sp. AN1015 TaxID=3133428 RepID=UPI0030BBEC59